ncbi:MAG TPA: flagellar motor protein MotB [Ruminiclostridium sp.]|nr:flagellar motor protein MotB [Ruminiclostridium sp.]
MSRRKEEISEGAPEWMATYSDLVTLLLCFFIMLFSMAIVDQNKFKEISASLSKTLADFGGSGGESILPYSGNSVITVDFQNTKGSEEAREKYIETAEDMVINAHKQIENRKIDNAKNSIRDTISEEGISDQVQVVEEKDYLLVRLDSEIFFNSGSAEIGAEGKKILSSLADTLRSINNEIMISGHTDNVPIHTSQYNSNWELSTARATNVVTYLVNIEKLNPELFTATGNGEFKPIGDNNTSEGRQKNRRIEIKILK